MPNPNGNGSTPMLLSVYETEEGIHLHLCDKCAGDLCYQWLKFAPPDETCDCCGKLNAVDVCNMHDLWMLSPRDGQTWDEYTATLGRLKGGAL